MLIFRIFNFRNPPAFVAIIFALSAGLSCETSNSSASPDVPDGEVVIEKVGIKICDDYVGKYIRCVDEKVPKSGRRQMLRAFAEATSSWKIMSTNPDLRKTLESTCAMALDVSRSSLRSYGCDW